MKNLFDYATKELSQDAFLRWLFENYDDSEIGDVSRKLLVKLISLSGKQIKLADINNVKTVAQYNNIDIIIDFYVGDEKSIMIIEDKTDSGQHDNQLERYRELVEKWNKNEPTPRPSYFIYYKTNFLTDDEISVLNSEKEWRPFCIEDIDKFFCSYIDHPNLIVRSYAEHISKAHKKLTVVSKAPIIEWDYVEGRTFFQQKGEFLFRKYHPNNNDKKVSEYDIYQGTYSSSRFYYTFSNPKYKEKYYPLLEFVYRNGNDTIDVYAHCSLRNGNNWVWKWQDEAIPYKDKEEIVKQIQQEFINIGFKKRSISSYKTQTIGTMKIDKNKTLDQLITELDKLFQTFVKVFDVINNI